MSTVPLFLTQTRDDVKIITPNPTLFTNLFYPVQYLSMSSVDNSQHDIVTSMVSEFEN